MRWAVESWAPEYGASFDAGELTPSAAEVDVEVEVPGDSWAPRGTNGAAPASTVLFLDGVRRIDARVWITSADQTRQGADESGAARMGIAASYAAGVVRCEEGAGGRGRAARVEHCVVRRAVFSPATGLDRVVTPVATWAPSAAAGDDPGTLSLALQAEMGALEQEVAATTGPADLVVVDGPLRRDPGHTAPAEPVLAATVGYIKTHHVAYLPAAQAVVVERLGAGERTPLFAIATRPATRYAWYLRLPGPMTHPWSGIVRCEAAGRQSPAAAAGLADISAATLPAYASAAHKDPRAPQNLYPVAGLERVLRRHLGDATLLERALRVAAAG